MSVRGPQYDNNLSGASDTWDNDNASPILYADYFVNDTPPVASGNIKVWNGTSFEPKPAKVWDGLAFVTKPAKVWNGSSWVETSY